MREATIRVIPIFTHPTSPFGWSSFFYLFRFALLMLMVMRFYLGAVVVANGPDPSASIQNDTIGLFSGVAHFLLFFAWASTIDVDTRNASFFQFSPFEIALFLVLLYDLAWWLMSWGNRYEKLNLWTFINTTTCVFCVAIHVMLEHFFLRFRLIESIVFLPVILISLIDIAEITLQRELFRGWFQNL